MAVMYILFLYNDVIRALTHVSRFLQHCIQQDYLIYKKSFLSTVYANVSASRILVQFDLHADLCVKT